MKNYWVIRNETEHDVISDIHQYVFAMSEKNFTFGISRN